MCLICVNLIGSMNTAMSCRKNSQHDFPCYLQEQDAPKIRKPYTVTKQREKWTGDEHLKFLEAIKLHGRAWKSVKEHIGTKNATQIRSHAQKFFTKVARDLTIGNANSIIEVPPPRPKKKSTHPYPRKSQVDVSKYPELHEEKSGSPASAGRSFTDLSDSCVSGPVSPASMSTDHKNREGSWGSNNEELDNASLKSFQLFGTTIVVSDVDMFKSVHPKRKIEEVAEVPASSTTTPANKCSHGLLPLFNFAPEMDPAALVLLHSPNSRSKAALFRTVAK